MLGKKRKLGRLISDISVGNSSPCLKAGASLIALFSDLTLTLLAHRIMRIPLIRILLSSLWALRANQV